MNLFEIEKDDIHNKFSDFFEFQSILGFGSFGVVVSAKAKSTLEECAVKVLY
jgi:serine/threonine protein kinase